jgi:hypothetical protein
LFFIKIRDGQHHAGLNLVRIYNDTPGSKHNNGVIKTLKIILCYPRNVMCFADKLIVY